MKAFLLGTVTGIVLAVLSEVAWIAGGLIDVAADAPHSQAVFQLIDWTRERAVSRQAAGVTPPADLADPARIRRGAGNYDAMCANCHLSPGVEDSEIRKGLYPQPPNLARASQETETQQTEGERFWTIKHGIKGSGMAAWAKGGMRDGEIWDLTALLRALPRMSAAEYRDLVEASEGHTHTGADGDRSGGAPTHHHHKHEADADSHDRHEHHD